jgi:hypothetical protein
LSQHHHVLLTWQERRAHDERFARRDSSALCELAAAADALELRGLVDLG